MTTLNSVSTSFQIYAMTLQKHPSCYDSYLRNPDNLLIALDTVATKHLSHKIVDLAMLNSYLEAIDMHVGKQNSKFKFVIHYLYHYYGGPLVTFKTTAEMLVVQMTILNQTCYIDSIFIVFS